MHVRIRDCLATLALVGAVGWPLAGQAQTAPSRRDDTGMPKDAAALIARTEACNHWSGEPAESPQRRAEILKAMQRLKCHRLEQDERRLRKKYHDAPSVLEAIETAKSMS